MKQYEIHESGLDLNEIKQIEENPSREWQIYLAAKMYIRLGYFVLPLAPNTKKLPAKKYGVNYGKATKSANTIRKWFEPNEGQFPGWNIGIACGIVDGVFAIDVDNHGDRNGFVAIEKFKKVGKVLPSGPKQITPGGGEHRILRWQENAACTASKIAPGIDTRGGDEKRCRGHIVAWPSVVPDGKYVWSEGGELPEIPEWVMERMGVAWRPSSNKSGRGNENVDDSDYEQIVPLEQIVRMLAAIDVDDIEYSLWIKIGMAIKSQYPDKSGLDAWDNWSSNGIRYEKTECIKRWDGFSDTCAVRIGTLFHYAKKAGWEVEIEKGDVKPNKHGILVASMNEEYAMIAIGGKLRILWEHGQGSMTRMNYELLEKDTFRSLLMNDTIEATDIKGNIKSVSVADIWLADEHRRTFTGGIGLYPQGAPENVYNTWSGFAVSPAPGDCTLFLDHAKNIICDGDEENYEWMMDWLADLVQEPHDPKGCAIVMVGGQGTGKGAFAETIASLFGPHSRHLIDDSHLTSNFNAHLLDAIVVFADEITWGGNKKSAGKLKGMVTGKHLVGERKGIDALTYDNMIHLIIASNSDWVVPTDNDSRRWFVVHVADDQANNRDYFEPLFHEIENGGKEALLHFLLHRKITRNLRLAPRTKALQQQKILSRKRDTILYWWTHCLLTGSHETATAEEFEPGQDKMDQWPTLVEKSTFYGSYVKWAKEMGHRPISNVSFFTKLKKVTTIGSTRVSVPGGRRYAVKLLPLDRSREQLEDKYGISFGDDDD